MAAHSKLQSRSRIILLAVIGVMAARRSKQFVKGKQIKRFWRRSIFRDRKLYSEYFNVYQNLRDKDREFHFKYVRMSKERFDHLLGLVRDNPLKIKQHWTLRPVRLLVKKVYSTVQHCCGWSGVHIAMPIVPCGHLYKNIHPEHCETHVFILISKNQCNACMFTVHLRITAHIFKGIFFIQMQEDGREREF